MRSLEIDNPVLNKTYVTRLGADYASGVTLTVESNNSFSNNDLLVVGEPGEEKSESKKMDSKSGITSMAIPTALNFTHPKGTWVYKTPWDYVAIERRTSALGSFSEISKSPIQWDNRNNQTIYFDEDATDTYGYRFRFYNSVTTKYSEYSPTIEGSGFTRYQAGFMIDRVYALADPERKWVKPEDILDFLSEGQDIIYTHNSRYWFLLIDVYKGANGIACLANTNVYSLAQYTTFGHLESVRYHYSDGVTNYIYHLDQKTSLEFDRITYDLNDTTDNWARIYKLLPADSSSANGYLQIHPKTKDSSIGTLYPNYYELMSQLDDVADTTQVPLPKILERYAAAQVLKLRGLNEKAALLERFLVSGNPDITPPDLVNLDQMDKQKKGAAGRPKSLVVFRGQRGVSRLYSAPRFNSDYQRENSFD